MEDSCRRAKKSSEEFARLDGAEEDHYEVDTLDHPWPTEVSPGWDLKLLYDMSFRVGR